MTLHELPWISSHWFQELRLRSLHCYGISIGFHGNARVVVDNHGTSTKFHELPQVFLALPWHVQPPYIHQEQPQQQEVCRRIYTPSTTRARRAASRIYWSQNLIQGWGRRWAKVVLRSQVHDSQRHYCNCYQQGAPRPPDSAFTAAVLGAHTSLANDRREAGLQVRRRFRRGFLVDGIH